MQRLIPLVLLPTDVKGRRSDDIAAIAPEVQAGGQGDFVTYQAARMFKKQVIAAPPGIRTRR